MSDRLVPDFAIQRRWLPINAGSSAQSSFTVLTYNILAQCLIRRDLFAYCSKQTLKAGHRRTQLTVELLSLNPDVFALQECDSDLYNQHFAQTFANHGFESKFTCKDTDASVKHGCAIFWRRGKFSLLDYREIQFHELSEEHSHDDERVVHQTGIGPRLGDHHPTSVYYELKRPNVAQIAVLKCNDSESGIIVSNTHLWWDPRFRFVRLAQCHRLLSTINELQQQWRYAVMMLGDFNITPTTLIYSYLTKRSIPHEMWYKMVTPSHHGVEREGKVSSLFTGSKPSDEEINNEESAGIDWNENERNKRRYDAIQSMIDDRQSWPPLHSVYSRYCASIPDDIREHVRASQSQPWCDWTDEPPFTHYVQRWVGTLDYILIQPPASEADINTELVPVSLLEIPSERVVTSQTALPNSFLASDHVCIGCKFAITSNKHQ